MLKRFEIKPLPIINRIRVDGWKLTWEVASDDCISKYTNMEHFIMSFKLCTNPEDFLET